MTDGWLDLRSGLRSAVSLGADALSGDEEETLQHLSRDVETGLLPPFR